MTLTPITASAPAHWASYLVNGDGSGLDPDDCDAAERFADWLAGRTHIHGFGTMSCSDAEFFSWNHDARGVCLRAGFPDIGGAMCLEYTALVETESAPCLS